jgi:hypothetical protein
VGLRVVDRRRRQGRPGLRRPRFAMRDVEALAPIEGAVNEPRRV